MPDCYSAYDWSRSYLLPGHVTANIPRRGGEGEPGAYNNARGLLVEICRATGAHPVALHYADTFSSDTGLTRTTALARAPGTDTAPAGLHFLAVSAARAVQ
ncbi:MAG: hypothetical protein ACRDTE_08240 [Pseudonocardiaceae bacterium]